jgi:hypothetical protein
MKAKSFLIGIGVCACLSVTAENKHSKTTLYPSYEGLVMAGYQGWFDAPDKGVMYPDEAKLHIDMWPDVSEYEQTYG